MKNAPIRLIILFGSLTLAAIIFTQIFWVSKAVKNQEEQFSHNVQMALRNVVESLCEINGNDITNDPIDQISSNYFIARTNYQINPSSLDYLIRAEFQKRSLKEDFEFGVYDCQTRGMVYGDFISFGEDKVKPLGKLPELDNDEYYFGVYFPNKSGGLVNDLGFWKFTSLVTVFITVFFGYAMFVILRQKRLSEIQRDFINNMTHEFKTPLSTLILSSEVLKAEANSTRGRKYAEIVKSESQRLQDHITQFLDTTYIEQNLGRAKEKIDVNEIIQGVSDRFSGFDKNLELTLSGTNPVIYGDSQSFEKIIFNLIDNAVKYGVAVVKVETNSDDKKALIRISNDGEPIPEDQRRKIFNKFYRIPTGDRHEVKGFGLGLYFVKKSIKAFRGKLSLISDADLTTFTLSIPIR
ncbi:MAG: HAMP domain-containing histidine kinase [Cyclobacteriaceae bacterium]